MTALALVPASVPTGSAELSPPSTAASPPAPAARPAKAKRVLPSPSVTAARRLAQVSERARQVAALILDVLGGNRTPGAAAQAMGLSVARFYVIEQRAILGLVAACETPTSRGPTPDLQVQIRRLEIENRRLNQALLRQQAIVRNTQRGLGLTSPRPPAAPPPGKAGAAAAGGKGRRKRRPTVRALRQARRVAGVHSPNAASAASLPGDQRGG
jgi:hypothetical protein